MLSRIFRKKLFLAVFIGSVSSASAQQAGVPFEQLPKVSINGTVTKKLQTQTSQQCAQTCAGNNQCQGYTFTASQKLCEHKNGVSFASASSEHVSGMRSSAGISQRPITNSRPLTWQPKDTVASFVSRVRRASAVFGQSCAAEQAQMKQIGEQFQFSIPSTKVPAGGKVKVRWEYRGSDVKLPVWFMVSSNKPLRFKGRGFYALTANAIAPYGIPVYANQDRAMLALLGQGRTKRGTVELEVLEAGQMNIQASLVGYLRRCEVSVGIKSAQQTLNIQPSRRPEIVVSQQFEVDPKSSFQLSPDGNRVLVQKGSGIQLVTRDLQDVILQTTGKEPRFSPTGRFLFMKDRTSSSQREIKPSSIVFDASDGSRLFEMENASRLIWTENDSFVMYETPFYGDAYIQNTLTARKLINYKVRTYKNGSGFENNHLRIDLENDVIVEANGVASQGREPPTYVKLSSATKKSTGHLGPKFNQLSAVAPKLDVSGIELRWPNYATPARPVLHGALANNTAVASVGNNLVNQNWRTRSIGNNAVASTRSLWQALSDLGVQSKLVQAKTYFDPIRPPEFNGNLSAQQRRVLWKKYEAPLDRRLLAYYQQMTTAIPSARRTLSKRFDIFQSKNNQQPDFDRGCNTFFKNGKPIFKNIHIIQTTNRQIWIPHQLCQYGSSGGNLGIATLILDTKGKRIVQPQGHESFPEFAGFLKIGLNKFDVRLLDDDHIAFFSSVSNGLGVTRLSDGKTVFENYNLPGGNSMVDVRMTEDGRHLVQLNSDGTFYVHSITNNKIVLSGRYVDDELVVWTDDLRFDATAEGAHFVNLKFPGHSGQYTFQQFGSDLKVPGLANKVLAGHYQQKRVDVDVPPSITGSFKADKDGLVSGTITAEAFGGLASVRILQDGIVTGEFKSIKNGQPTPISFKRVAGTRWVNLVAVDKNGLISHPLGKDMGGFVGNLPRVRLLAMGIDDYDNNDFDLNFAGSDADRLAASLLAQNGKTLSLASSTILKNRDVTPDRVIRSLEKLVDNMSASDTAVLFFAGHGVRGEDGKFYVALSEINSKNIKGTGFAWEKIAPILKRARGRVIVLLDACQSGIAGTSYFATNDDVANGLLDAIPSGLTILSASKGRELSSEWAKTGGGLYTTALVDVLTNKRGNYDTNRNGSIEVSELYQGVKNHVKQAHSVLVTFLQKNFPEETVPGPQTPWLARNQMIGDYTLF